MPRLDRPQQPPTLTVRCISNTAPSSPMFTEGKTYTAQRGNRRLYTVQDDRGHQRSLLIHKGRAFFPLGTSSASLFAQSYAATFEVTAAAVLMSGGIGRVGGSQN